jgi:hypothetical protein
MLGRNAAMRAELLANIKCGVDTLMTYIHAHLLSKFVRGFDIRSSK